MSSRLVRKSRGVGSAVPIFSILFLTFAFAFTFPFPFAFHGLLGVFVSHVLVVYS